jgi:uncharacterized protein
VGVVDDLVDLVQPSADVPIGSIAVGMHYTAVTSRWAGLAATDRCATELSGPLGAGVARLQQMTAREVLALLGSGHALGRTIRLATLNSLIEPPSDAVSVPDGQSLVFAHARGRRVVLIGRFRFATALAEVAKVVTVLEFEPRAGESPASEAHDVLAQAEVVAVTGTTLVNGTFDDLVPSFPLGATVIMLGPSTPLSPVLFDHRVDILAGMAVVDPGRLLRAVSQGASRHQLLGAKPVVLTRSRALSPR